MALAKTCRRCGEIKLPDAFPLNSRLRDGLDSWCKACRKKYCRERTQRLGTAKQNSLISTVRHARRGEASYLVYDPETGLYHSPKDFT